MPYLGDGAYPQLLLLAEWSHAAAEQIHRAIVMGTAGEQRLIPILRPYDPIGSTDDVCFETTKICFDTTKSHINRVAQDSELGDGARPKLEAMPEVVGYAKNQGLNLKIPYTFEGRAANYVPDFLIRLRDARLDRRRRPPDAPPRGLRRGEEGEAGQGRGGRRPVGPGRQQLGRPRPLGVPRGHAHGERGGPDPGEVLPPGWRR